MTSYYLRAGGTGNGTGPSWPAEFPEQLPPLLPGDVVYLMEGTWRRGLKFVASGTNSFPIQIKPYASGLAIIDCGQLDLYNLWIQGSWLRFEALEGTDRLIACREAAGPGVFLDGRGVPGQASNNLLRGLDVADYGWVGGTPFDMFACGGIMGRQGPMNITVDSCKIARTKYPVSGNQETAIGIWKCYGGWRILYCDLNGRYSGGGAAVYDIIGGGESVVGSGGIGYKDSEVAYCNIKGGSDDCIEAEGECNRVKIHHNFIDAAGSRTCLACAPVGTGPLEVYRNIMINAMDTIVKVGSGSAMSSVGMIKLYNNLGITDLASPDANCISTSGNKPQVSQLTSRNNIWWASRYIVEEYAGGNGNMQFDHDAFFSKNRDGANCIKWRGIQYTYEDWKRVTLAMNQQANGFYGNPMLNAATYELRSTSPCVDTGQVLPGISDVFNGAGPDIGAVESPYLGVPNAAFTASVATGYPPLTVAFTDKSFGVVVTLLWDFGDGVTSAVQNPTHVYLAAGNYQATLTVFNSAGDSTTAQMTITVMPYGVPIAGFSAAPASGEVPLTVSFTDASQGIITSRLWNFGDGATSIELNPQHTYTVPGVYTAVLTVTGPGGSDSAQVVVNAAAIPVADAAFRAEPPGGLAPLTVQFQDESTGPITSWAWDFGDSVTSAQQNPSHVYVNVGSYTVKLTVTGRGGSDTTIRTVTATLEAAKAGTNWGIIAGVAGGIGGFLALLVALSKRERR